jgi:hypothetical protein
VLHGKVHLQIFDFEQAHDLFQPPQKLVVFRVRANPKPDN